MPLFAKPRSIQEAYGVAMHLLRFSGLFPFWYDEAHKEFHVSRKLLCVTVGHILVYSYVNITSILENWRDYSQPMIGHSSLVALGNLVHRLLSIAITFLIMVPPVFGSVGYVTTINMYVRLMDELVLLDIDVSCILRRIHYMSCGVTVFTSGLLVFASWHSIYFYELITQRPPELKYYLVVSLSFFYKTLFLCYGGMQLFGIYMISEQLNKYLEQLKERHREIYEQQHKAMYSLLSEGKSIN